MNLGEVVSNIKEGTLSPRKLAEDEAILTCAYSSIGVAQPPPSSFNLMIPNIFPMENGYFVTISIH